MLDAFVFLLLLQAVGLIGFPFAAALFARLFGGGLAFGRPLGSSLNHRSGRGGGGVRAARGQSLNPASRGSFAKLSLWTSVACGHFASLGDDVGAAQPMDRGLCVRNLLEGVAGHRLSIRLLCDRSGGETLEGADRGEQTVHLIDSAHCIRKARFRRFRVHVH